MTEHKRANLREATVPDLRRIVKLVMKLIRLEKEMGLTDIVQNEESLRNALTEYIAEILFRNDAKIFIIDKSGRILGVFIAEVVTQPPFNAHQKACHIWVGYAKKNPVYIKKVTNALNDWAKNKGCSIMKTQILAKNERTIKLMKAIGCIEKYITFERKV